MTLLNLYHIFPISELYEFISDDIPKNIDKLDSNHKIMWNYNNGSEKNDNVIYIKSTNIMYDSFIKRIPKLLAMINFLNKKYQKVTIYLILTNCKKSMPLDCKNDVPPDCKITPYNANSGYTDFTNKTICIFREEEFEKVLFHELMHYFELDYRNITFNQSSHVNHTLNSFNNINEAFADYWGIIYHCIYLSLIIGKKASSILSIEYEFIQNQATIVNNFLELGNWSDKKTIIQKTNTYHYYIIKYLLFRKTMNLSISPTINDF
ncbi:MAG: hypothetical protein WCN92_11650, partial [Eubacteriales bacterium]